MVEALKWTLAAASNSFASARVIQSAAEGIGQSALAPVTAEAGFVDGASFDDEPDPSLLDDVSPELDPGLWPSLSDELRDPPLDEPSASPWPSDVAPLLDPEVAVARRSFLAQPEPLKWTAGAANALRTRSLPQAGQAAGPST
jgi:hypothetical protein